jgi:uncharacterized membrane protein
VRSQDEKANSTFRLEALSDGVFAVAMTMLVLDIKVPQVRASDLGAALLAMAPHLWSFVLSFLIVTFYWTGHHVLFNAIQRSNRFLLWLNATHLLSVVLLPFSTALLANYNGSPLAVDIYGLNIIACSVTLIIVWLYAARGDEGVPREAVVTTALRLAVNPVICTVALGVAFINTTAATLLYVVTPAWYIVTGPRRTAARPGFWPFRSRKAEPPAKET